MTDEIAPPGTSPGKLSFFRRAAGTGLGLAAVSALAWWQWDRLVSHPWVSAAVAAGAALLAAVVGLGKKVWAELEGKWAKSVAEWIDAQVRLYGSLLFSGFRRRYYRQLLYRHRVFNVRGLQTQGVFTLELEKVFVDLRWRRGASRR